MRQYFYWANSAFCREKRHEKRAGALAGTHLVREISRRADTTSAPIGMGAGYSYSETFMEQSYDLDN